MKVIATSGKVSIAITFIIKLHIHSYYCSSGQFKSAKLKDKEYTLEAQIFFTTLQKKKEMDAPHFEHLLADGQLLIYDADCVQ